MQQWSKSFACSPFTEPLQAYSGQVMWTLEPYDIRLWMNQTGWNPPLSQFIRVKILLLKMVAGRNPFCFFKSTGFTSFTFPMQPEFSQNQPATITLNTGFPWTLVCFCVPLPFLVPPLACVLKRSWDLFSNGVKRALFWEICKFGVDGQ